MTAAAPSNPITTVTYTGFRFAPEQDYYQSFQAGVLANLAVSRTCQAGHCSPRLHADYGAPASAACLEHAVIMMIT